MRTASIIINQFRVAKAEQSPYIKYMITNNTNLWYITIKDLEAPEREFDSCEYLVKIIIPSNYPLSPPEFYFITPTGLFTINEKVCVVLGDGCQPTIVGYVNTLLAKMLDWRAQPDMMQTTLEDKRQLAKASRQYNDSHHEEIIKKLRE